MFIPHNELVRGGAGISDILVTMFLPHNELVRGGAGISDILVTMFLPHNELVRDGAGVSDTHFTKIRLHSYDFTSPGIHAGVIAAPLPVGFSPDVFMPHTQWSQLLTYAIIYKFRAKAHGLEDDVHPGINAGVSDVLIARFFLHEG